ncbi:MAG: hypothetical protein ACJ71P_15995 [Nitrososphaeraceae archaeon]|jgi:hypothetical protein
MITNGNREKQLIIGDIGLIIEGKKVNTHDNLMVTYVYRWVVRVFCFILIFDIFYQI